MKNRLIAGIYFALAACLALYLSAPLFSRRPPENLSFDVSFIKQNLLTVFTTFVSAAILGPRLFDNPAKKTIFKTGTVIAVVSTTVPIILMMLVYGLVNTVSAVSHHNLGGFSLLEFLGLLFASPISILFSAFIGLIITAWISIPIAILAAWGLAALGGRFFFLLLSLACLVAFALAVNELLNAPYLPSDTPRISLSRPLGTDCGPSDSASIKRKSSHPRSPTGLAGSGWNSKALLDESLRVSASENTFQILRDHSGLTSAVTGYVSFENSGTLRIRSYDDLYGAVYCGWSPEEIHLPAASHSAEKQFIKLPLCPVGDGGLEQVYEVCWFPDGEARGVLLFSSAHLAAPAQAELPPPN